MATKSTPNIFPEISRALSQALDDKVSPRTSKVRHRQWTEHYEAVLSSHTKEGPLQAPAIRHLAPAYTQPMIFLFPFKFPEIVYRYVTIILVGALFNWVLYGVLLVQIWFYYTACPNDTHIAKLTVLLAFTLETVQTTMFTRDLFKGLTLDYEAWNLFQIDQVNTVWISVPLLTGLIALLTQAFYCHRIYVLMKSKYAVAAVAMIVMLMILQIGSATAVAIQTREAGLLTNVLETKISLITIGIWAAGGVACDTMIAIIMIYILKKNIYDDSTEGTQRIVNKATRWVIETGLVTASFSIITMILALLPGHPTYYQIAILILAKMYSNSMLAFLNRRKKVVSNSGPDSPPSWNESVAAQPMNMSEMEATQGLEFRRDESLGSIESEV